MDALKRACHTDYGFSDVDCALFAWKLIENLERMRRWMDEEGHMYDLTNDEDEAKAAEECRKLREYWRKGGNLTDWEPALRKANITINSLPGWMFGE
jgi:hypothetical protein